MANAPSLLALARTVKKAYPDATTPASEIARDILDGNVEDEERNVTWEESYDYVTDYGNGPVDAYTRWGVSPAGVYFVDDGDDTERETSGTVYWSQEDAEAAAEELADSQNEANAGEDADDCHRRALKETAGEPDYTGSYAVYWDTVGDDSRVICRYATQEQAEAATELRNIELHEANPGSRLLCGYETRRLEDGKWVAVENTY